MTEKQCEKQIKRNLKFVYYFDDQGHLKEISTDDTVTNQGKVRFMIHDDKKYKAISHLRKLQKLPGRIKKYFKHPKITYAEAAI